MTDIKQRLDEIEREFREYFGGDMNKNSALAEVIQIARDLSQQVKGLIAERDKAQRIILTVASQRDTAYTSLESLTAERDEAKARGFANVREFLVSDAMYKAGYEDAIGQAAKLCEAQEDRAINLQSQRSKESLALDGVIVTSSTLAERIRALTPTLNNVQ